MEIEVWLAFVAIWVVGTIGVGPNSVTCAAAGATNGFSRGMWAALGITAAGLVHSLIAAFGFSTIMLAYSGLYSTLKWMGVAYLAYLGLRLWLRKPAALDYGKGMREGRATLLKRAFFISLSNPQAILTYFAIFAPMIDPSRPLYPQLLVLVPTAVGIVFLAYTFYVLLGTPLKTLITSVSKQRILNRVTGTFYMFTASVLATGEARR